MQHDESTKAAYQNALRAYYEYQRSGLEHRSKVFAWQLLSSKVIFFVVIALVLSGVCFSGVQFHSSLRAKRAVANAKGVVRLLEAEASRKENKQRGNAPPKVSNTEENDKSEYSVMPEAVTEIEASLQGIRVSSPVLGVIILALSFLFFYLYLKYVYPINEIF